MIPGDAAARDKSMVFMRAWASGLLTNAACSICGSLRSAMNCPRPVSRRRSSRREMERPTKEIFGRLFILRHQFYETCYDLTYVCSRRIDRVVHNNVDWRLIHNERQRE